MLEKKVDINTELFLKPLTLWLWSSEVWLCYRTGRFGQGHHHLSDGQNGLLPASQPGSKPASQPGREHRKGTISTNLDLSVYLSTTGRRPARDMTWASPSLCLFFQTYTTEQYNTQRAQLHYSDHRQTGHNQRETETQVTDRGEHSQTESYRSELQRRRSFTEPPRGRAGTQHSY